MSKFKVIEGGGGNTKVSDITRIRKLDNYVKPIEHTLTNRGLVTYAYHYAVNNSARRAEDLLERVHPNYFNMEIYKDLYHAFYCHSASKLNPDPELQRQAEYIVIVKRSLELFKQLSFRGKPAFVKFYQDHMKRVKFTNCH